MDVRATAAKDKITEHEHLEMIHHLQGLMLNALEGLPGSLVLNTLTSAILTVTVQGLEKADPKVGGEIRDGLRYFMKVLESIIDAPTEEARAVASAICMVDVVGGKLKMKKPN
jgi:hypothetical protein